LTYKVKLSDVCTIKYGKDHKVLKDGLYPVYGTGGIMRYVNEFIYDEASVLIPRKGTLSNIFYVDEPFWTIDTLFYTQIDKSKIWPKYLYYYLKRFNFDEMNVGTAVPSLTTALLNELELKIPSLNKQKKILDFLLPFDQKIETNNAIIANLEAQAQAIFKSWFVDFEPFQDGGFVESELGMIPEGWEVKTISEFSHVTSGKRPMKRLEDGDVPIYGANGQTGWTDEVLIDKSCILIGRVGTLGSVQRLNDKIWASDNTLVFTSADYEFLYFQLKRIDYAAYNRGSTQPLITQGDIKNIKVIYPNNVVMEKFSNVVGLYFDLIWQLEKQNKNLAQIRDTLLPKLMSGEIRVVQDEVEEIENPL